MLDTCWPRARWSTWGAATGPSSPREAISFVLVCYQFAAAALRSLLPLINR